MKVLEVVSALNCGGVERLLYDYCSRICNNDIQIDIIVFDKNEGILERDFIGIGCNIYKVTRIRDNVFKLFLEMNEIIKNGNYDVIHCHQGYLSLPAILIAKKYNVPKRISHAHFAFVPENKMKKITRCILTKFCKLLSTHLYACGKDAAKWAWGNNKVSPIIINNAIDTSKYKYNACTRKKIRNELGLNGKVVIGNVARLSYQKNHEFLLKVFKKIVLLDKNVVLLLIGNGELMETVKKQINELKIKNNVILLGARDDVSSLLNAMDVFVLPSLFEGLPITLIEAQCNGLNCFVSNTVTKEANFTEKVNYMDIFNTENEWADSLINSNNYNRNKISIDMIKNSGYDIEVEANRLYKLYCAN